MHVFVFFFFFFFFWGGGGGGGTFTPKVQDGFHIGICIIFINMYIYLIYACLFHANLFS